MKVLGIELNDKNVELCIMVEVVDISDNDELEDYVLILEDLLPWELSDDYSYKVHTERFLKNFIKVYCDEITLNKKGVELLTRIYNDIVNAHFGNTKVYVFFVFMMIQDIL